MSPTADATGPPDWAGAGLAAAGACAGAGASPPRPSRSSTIRIVPTGTVSPTLKRRSDTLPALGAPMVTVALSVITSTISWFSVTGSPSWTSQLTISPSATPSPMSGSLNSSFDMSRAVLATILSRAQADRDPEYSLPPGTRARTHAPAPNPAPTSRYERTTDKMAGTIRCESGRYSISRVYGNGVSKPVTRTGGASR